MLPSEKREQRINALIRRNGGYFECHYCSTPLTMYTATLDHVHPRSRGGSNRLDNLVLACAPCNTRKGNQVVSSPDRRAVMIERSCRHQSAAAFCLNCAGP